MAGFVGGQSEKSVAEDVANSMGPKTDPRFREVLASLSAHLHMFVREIGLTNDEFYEGLAVIAKAGQMTTETRNEVLLLTDAIGLEAAVDEMTHKRFADGSATESSILGPYYRADAPQLQNGDSIIQKDLGGQLTWVHGRVQDAETGKPIAGVEINTWVVAGNGKYEQVDPDQPDKNMRGIFTTDDAGRYNFYGIKPINYSIPVDGPTGYVIDLMDRHPFRTSHIHFYLISDRYQSLVTQIFPRDDKYLDSDSVYAVKEELVVDFVPATTAAQKGKGAQGKTVVWELEYDFKLTRE